MKSRRQSGGGAVAAVDGNTSSGCGGGGGGCSKMERKDVEKNRRLHMKGLCLKLSSLVPATSTHHIRHYQSSNASSQCNNNNKDAITQLDQLDSAAAYIKQLKGRIDELKRRKQGGGGCSPSASGNKASSTTTTATASLPVIEVRHQDSTLDVALVSEAGKPFKLHEVISVLEQEGAEVVSASFSVVGDKIFYTLHSQALCPRIGLEADRVTHRLHGLAAAASAAAAVYTA
ncbi:transcription factor bHLH168-like [Lolium rigidum]|uniref:transcription factor bHLH168-like n=1 Tax=Lolium rigidum TaxID=89674 RepID=UPI001F5DE095|nr:transcription factor bHLH168-like [Lolium rigidum]